LSSPEARQLRTLPPGLLPVALGAVGLAAVVSLLPILGDADVSFAERVLSYALAVMPVGVLVFGLLALAASLSTPRVLLAGAAAGLLGAAAAVYLAGRPEAPAGGAAPVSLALLFLADAGRICFAAALALALARHVTSVGVAFLVAAVATAADLFSVLAGPTKALVEEGSPALDFLLVIFPTFGQPLGFALGVADFVFLALFAAMARHLSLRPAPTLALGCAAILAAMLAGLILGTYLPALPFITLSFVLANADLALESLRKTRR
jgi:hypothetical protein